MRTASGSSAEGGINGRSEGQFCRSRMFWISPGDESRMARGGLRPSDREGNPGPEGLRPPDRAGPPRRGPLPRSDPEETPRRGALPRSDRGGAPLPTSPVALRDALDGFAREERLDRTRAVPNFLPRPEPNFLPRLEAEPGRRRAGAMRRTLAPREPPGAAPRRDPAERPRDRSVAGSDSGGNQGRGLLQQDQQHRHVGGRDAGDA